MSNILVNSFWINYLCKDWIFQEMEKILLEDIKTISIPGISEATGAYLCEGCVVCMNRQSHSSGVQLSLKGDKTASIPTEWSMAYTD